MPSKQFTLTTRLQKSELTEYLDSFVSDYNRIYRYAWHRFTSDTFKNDFGSENKFMIHLCDKFNILKRTCNSIMRDIKGHNAALKELKAHERSYLNIKIAHKIAHILKLRTTINTLKPMVCNGSVTKEELKKYRSAKKSLYFHQNKLNQMRQSLHNLNYQIENNIRKSCFGSLKMFKKQYALSENGYKSHKKWYNDFVKKRDSNIYAVGSSDEKQGNQMFQMFYDHDSDNFIFKIRKDHGYDTDEKYIYHDGLDFGYSFLRNHLKNICCSHQDGSESQSLSYRFHRKNNKWYLQVLLSVEFETYETNTKHGTIGFDYDDDFIELSETDSKGNLIMQSRYRLSHHGTGNKADSEIREIISDIVHIAVSKHKDISIERFDFKHTKIRTSRLIHNYHSRISRIFDYSRCIKALYNACHRRKVNIISVESCDIDETGLIKYGDQKKLNIRQAASYVIARNGQGFADEITI